MRPSECRGLQAAWPHCLLANSLPLFNPMLLLPVCQNAAEHCGLAGVRVNLRLTAHTHTGAKGQQKDALGPASHVSCSSSTLLGHHSAQVWEVLGRTLVHPFVNRDPCILQAGGWPEFGHEEMGVRQFSSHPGFCYTPQVLSRGSLGTQSELAHSHFIPMVV